MEDSCFTILCWFLQSINMNQPHVYIWPFPLEPRSHLPPHTTCKILNIILKAFFRIMVQENSIKNREKNIGDADRSKIRGLRWGFLVFFFFINVWLLLFWRMLQKKQNKQNKNTLTLNDQMYFFQMNLIIIHWYLC